MKPLFRQESCFTFHNVSISTVCGTFLFYGWFYFTFHNVSISTVPAILFSLLFIVFTFHNVSISTIQAVDTNSLVATLHSTMYLFLHTSSLLPVQLPGYFTFHNVSISTWWGSWSACSCYYFTFHNVSISTILSKIPAKVSPTLHSTMYLFLLP